MEWGVERGLYLFYLHSVHEWDLSKFGKESYFEWPVACMRNYVLHIVLCDGYNPMVYKSKENNVVLADQVACFFGC